MTQAAFRQFRPADLPQLQEIRRRAFAPVFDSFRQLTGRDVGAIAFAHGDMEQAELLADLCTSSEDREVVVTLAHDAPAGFAALSFNRRSRVGEIVLTAVDPAHAGAGLGEAMLRHALGRMRAQSMKVAEVATGADPSHAPARRAYEKVGFRPALQSVIHYRKL